MIQDLIDALIAWADKVLAEEALDREVLEWQKKLKEVGISYEV